MKKMLLAAATILAMTTAAMAQDATAPKAPEQEAATYAATIATNALTVNQVISIGDALRNLGNYPDATGKTVMVPFRFGGSTLMTIATNISEADRIRAASKEAYDKMVRQFAGAKPGEAATVPPEKMPEFNVHAEKMFASAANARLIRIKEAELCLSSTPEGKPVPPCMAVNAIPPSQLAIIVPIIER